MVKTSVMPNFSQFIVPSSLFTSNLSSMITIRMSMVITLLQFRLSLLFFVLFYRIMSVFTECIHPETKIAVFSYTVTYAKLSVYSKPDLSLSIIRHAIHLHRLYITVLQQRMLRPSRYPGKIMRTIILPQIHNLFHISA